MSFLHHMTLIEIESKTNLNRILLFKARTVKFEHELNFHTFQSNRIYITFCILHQFSIPISSGTCIKTLKEYAAVPITTFDTV